MHVRWKPSRAVPVAALALIIIIAFLHSRLSNGNVSARAVNPSSPSTTPTVSGARGRRPVRLEDVFIAVKSTRHFHQKRLQLLLDTWISKTKEHVTLSYGLFENKMNSVRLNGGFSTDSDPSR
ncbi:Beta-1,3-N-acetylglucosaminyltransferase manic fringe [Bagarius yarrelli]|uniref:Beta-1,3-N-acetylglucosaminyltransferase manic fringe n=1 Tax=Bagarius yarrelli TaxID=175774 RepID=A0A556VUJ0_BAGYA|nr:Beta-1,3-N-acetylglucosaminyltransferase manic fringe [Bagarius yarrelli]